jgi:hypothetical protein
MTRGGDAVAASVLLRMAMISACTRWRCRSLRFRSFWNRARSPLRLDIGPPLAEVYPSFFSVSGELESGCSVVHTPAEPPRAMLQLMNTVWTIVGLGIFSAVAAVLRWHGRGRRIDLGFVSQQWVSANRLSQQHDPRR